MMVGALAVGPRPAAAEGPGAPKISTSINAKGEVVAQVKLATRAATVRGLLGDATRWHKLAPTTVSVKATRDGECEKVKLQVRGLIEPFQVETRRCPTATGWLETKVASSDFSEYRNEWELADLGEQGSMVTFRTRTIPNVQVPESLLQMETKRILMRVFKNMLSALGEG
jgi:ribosome-associated toxin RatA of RatAB toxin-antitoxin module